MIDNNELNRLAGLARLAAEKGDLQGAARLLDEALLLDPANPDILTNAGFNASRLRNFPKAIEFLKKAYAQRPAPRLAFELAFCQQSIGDLASAENIIRASLKNHPKEFTSKNLLGVIIKNQGRHHEAIKIFLENSKVLPQDVSAWINLGNCYILTEDFLKAADAFGKAAKIEPKVSEHMRLLASAYSKMGDYNKALATLNGALLKAGSSNPKIRLDISGIYFLKSDFDKALEEIEKAIKIHSPLSMLLLRKGVILRRLGRIPEAIAIFEQNFAQDPHDTETLLALGNMYCFTLGNREKANQYYDMAYRLKPNDKEIVSQYCECLINSRYGNESEHIEKAYSIAKKMLEVAAPTPSLAGSLQGIFLRNVDFDSFEKLGDRHELLKHWAKNSASELHNQLGRVETMEDRLQLVDMHKAWGDRLQERIKPLQKVSANRSKNKIRIGLLSSDLRNHPVTYFVQPVLELYDKSRFEIYCYSFYNNEPDPMQQKIMRDVDRFHSYKEMAEPEIAQKIAGDDLDILFELGGTTHMSKIELCAYRPAPLQVSWLGYPHSVGLSRIDYILVDPYIKPEVPGLILEKPFEMPETWVTLGELGFRDFEIERGIPADKTGYITFGTMNNPYKYTRKLIKTWAEVMKRVEGSHFMFVRPEGEVKPFRENIIKEFSRNGIAESRIDFIGVRGKHRPYYNKIDIALDTFPHTGGTTTCESIWMGVPTVTLVGPAFFERLSYSNLSNAGLKDLCAFSEQQYIDIAVKLAEDRKRLLDLRHGLRSQIMNNPLGQKERFVRNFENLIVKTIN